MNLINLFFVIIFLITKKPRECNGLERKIAFFFCVGKPMYFGDSFLAGSNVRCVMFFVDPL